MNIFWLDTNPKKSAESLCDKHVVKMTLEYAQILCTALHTNGNDAPYKPTHQKHPAVIWATLSRENFYVLTSMLRAILNEYTFRYGKQHSCEKIYSFITANMGSFSFPDEHARFSEPPRCMPDQYKVPCVIQSYRNYYYLDKLINISPFRYTNRQKPVWLRNMILEGIKNRRKK